MKDIGTQVLRGLFLIGRLITAIALVYKILLINNVNDSVAQDPLEIWIASGIVLLLVSTPVRATAELIK